MTIEIEIEPDEQLLCCFNLAVFKNYKKQSQGENCQMYLI